MVTSSVICIVYAGGGGGGGFLVFFFFNRIKFVGSLFLVVSSRSSNWNRLSSDGKGLVTVLNQKKIDSRKR